MRNSTIRTSITVSITNMPTSNKIRKQRRVKLMAVVAAKKKQPLILAARALEIQLVKLFCKEFWESQRQCRNAWWHLNLKCMQKSIWALWNAYKSLVSLKAQSLIACGRTWLTIVQLRITFCSWIKTSETPKSIIENVLAKHQTLFELASRPFSPLIRRARAQNQATIRIEAK